MNRMFRRCCPKRRTDWLLPAALAALALLDGCSSIGPKPWEHDLMAEPAMRPDANATQSGIDDHIYFSKEGSSGGRSFAGGGCGCN